MTLDRTKLICETPRRTLLTVGLPLGAGVIASAALSARAVGILAEAAAVAGLAEGAEEEGGGGRGCG